MVHASRSSRYAKGVGRPLTASPVFAHVVHFMGPDPSPEPLALLFSFRRFVEFRSLFVQGCVIPSWHTHRLAGAPLCQSLGMKQKVDGKLRAVVPGAKSGIPPLIASYTFQRRQDLLKSRQGENWILRQQPVPGAWIGKDLEARGSAEL